jgi:hypothetical protein
MPVLRDEMLNLPKMESAKSVDRSAPEKSTANFRKEEPYD